MEFNFDKYSEATVNYFGEKFEKDSVMHYGTYAFSRNAERPIVTLDDDKEDAIGQRVQLSETDTGAPMCRTLFKRSFHSENWFCLVFCSLMMINFAHCYFCHMVARSLYEKYNRCFALTKKISVNVCLSLDCDLFWVETF